LSFSSVFLSFSVHFIYSLFPFSFFRHRCSRISISRRKGFRSSTGIYATWSRLFTINWGFLLM
jgi:hypothetical protein